MFIDHADDRLGTCCSLLHTQGSKGLVREHASTNRKQGRWLPRAKIRHVIRRMVPLAPQTLNPLGPELQEFLDGIRRLTTASWQSTICPSVGRTFFSLHWLFFLVGTFKLP